jgi:hypothetical protein
VQGGKDQVPGQGGLDRHRRRLLVADFAHHDHVRILSEDVSQAASECHPFLLADLGLTDTLEAVFDRIFER